MLCVSENRVRVTSDRPLSFGIKTSDNIESFSIFYKEYVLYSMKHNFPKSFFFLGGGGGGGLSLFWYVLVCVLSSFAIILKRKRELVALLLLSYGCLATVNGLWLFLAVPWVGLQFVIVVFLDHTHLLFGNVSRDKSR